MAAKKKKKPELAKTGRESMSFTPKGTKAPGMQKTEAQRKAAKARKKIRAAAVGAAKQVGKKTEKVGQGKIGIPVGSALVDAVKGTQKKLRKIPKAVAEAAERKQKVAPKGRRKKKKDKK